MSYLLGANALLQLCVDGSKANQWADTVAHSDVRISVVAVAIAKSVVKTSLANDQVRQNSYLLALESRVQALRDAKASMVPVDELVANSYSMWRTHVPLNIRVARNGQTKEMSAGQDTRMVIASAHAHGHTLVEPLELYHAELALQKVKVVAL